MSALAALRVVLPGQESLFRHVNDLARSTSALHEPFRLFAEYGVVLFVLLLLGGWWAARRQGDLRRMTAALWAPLGTLLAVGLNQPLGNAVHEARPYDVLPHVEVLVSRTTDFSFPSDHAVMAGAVAAGLLLVDRRLGVVAALLAVLMAFTRVYVGAHFPADVVAGLVFGAAVTLVAYLLLRVPGEAIVHTLARTPVAPLLGVRPRPGS